MTDDVAQQAARAEQVRNAYANYTLAINEHEHTARAFRQQRAKLREDYPQAFPEDADAAAQSGAARFVVDVVSEDGDDVLLSCLADDQAEVGALAAFAAAHGVVAESRELVSYADAVRVFAQWEEMR